MAAGIGHNSASFNETEADASAPIDVETAQIIDRVVRVLAAALGKANISDNVLRKRQGLETLSLRQLLVYCVTHDDPDIAIVPLVKLSKIIGFDRGTVRDDRAAVERAAEIDEQVYEFVESAREMVLAIPYLVSNTQLFFIGMDIGRCKSRLRQRRLQELKKDFEKSLAKASSAEQALRDIGRDDLADYHVELRKKEPWNPLKDARPKWT